MHIYSNTYVYMILYMYVYMCDRVRARALFFFREIQTAVDGIEYLKLGSDWSTNNYLIELCLSEGHRRRWTKFEYCDSQCAHSNRINHCCVNYQVLPLYIYNNMRSILVYPQVLSVWNGWTWGPAGKASSMVERGTLDPCTCLISDPLTFYAYHCTYGYHIFDYIWLYVYVVAVYVDIICIFVSCSDSDFLAFIWQKCQSQGFRDPVGPLRIGKV